MNEVSTTPTTDTYKVEEDALTFSDGIGRVIQYERNEDLSVMLASLTTGTASFVVVLVGLDGETADRVLVEPIQPDIDPGAVLGDALAALEPVYRHLHH